MLEALRRFGAPLHDLTAADLSVPGITFQMGNAPNRIDLLTEVASLTFPAAWDHRVEGRYGAQRMWILSREDLITNKRAVGRPQDLEDVRSLEVNAPAGR